MLSNIVSDYYHSRCYLLLQFSLWCSCKNCGLSCEDSVAVNVDVVGVVNVDVVGYVIVNVNVVSVVIVNVDVVGVVVLNVHVGCNCWCC